MLAVIDEDTIEEARGKRGFVVIVHRDCALKREGNVS